MKMRREINQLWLEVRDKITKALRVARRISITTDIWTSKGCTSSFLGVTVHFYNSETKSRGANKIACREFPDKHSAENIAKLILKVCDEYSIRDKLTHIIPDNGSNMVKAIKVFNIENRSEMPADALEEDEEEGTSDDDSDDFEGLETSDEETEIDENEVAEELEREVLGEVLEHEERDRQLNNIFKQKSVRRGKCFSHTMQLPIGRVTKAKHLKFGKALRKTKTFVVKYRTSAKAKAILRKTTFKKKLLGYVKTRWFSDLAMCKSVIEAFENPDKPLSILTEEMAWKIEISLQDIRMLKTYCEILDPFAKHTDILGGENYSTIQLVYPTLVDLLGHLEEMSHKPGMVRFCEGLTKEMKKYFAHVLDPDSSEFDATCIAATYLDPCWNSILSEEQVEIAKSHLLELCKEYTEEEKKTDANANELENHPVSATTPSPLAFLNYRHVSKKLPGPVGAADSISALFKSDLETYVREGERIRSDVQNESKRKTNTNIGLDEVIEIDASTASAAEEREPNSPMESPEVLLRDPLDYWVSEEARYYSPIARVAQDMLTIPATSTPSERLFSASGLLSEGKMSSISPENLEKRVLVKVNIGKSEA